MLVSKEEFKRLQKEGGGFGGVDYMCTAKFISGPLDLKHESIGNISVRSNGVFFDIVMGKKVFVSIERIESVNVRKGFIEFNVNQDENNISLLFGIEKERELNKLCEAIVSRKGPLNVVNQIVENNEDEPRCPKCQSNHLHVQKKGFGVGKAAVGGLAIGPLGLLAGGIGKNKLELTCLKCGYRFKPGK